MRRAELNKHQIKLGFIGLGIMGEPPDATFALIRLEYSSMESQPGAG